MFCLLLKGDGPEAAIYMAEGFKMKCHRQIHQLLEMFLQARKAISRQSKKQLHNERFRLTSLIRSCYHFIMNKLSREKQTRIIAALVEGNSLRATARMCDVAFNTVLKFLPEIGSACAEYQDKTLRNLKSKRIQCDECWTFCYAKEKNVPTEKKGQFGFGDVWTWIAIDADTKLVPSFMVGNRDAKSANMFIDDLASRLATRVQLTTDGLRVYLEAIEGAFGCEVDYAMLIKTYESSQEERRYSPAVCTSCERKAVTGHPDHEHISTSYVERVTAHSRMRLSAGSSLTTSSFCAGATRTVKSAIRASAIDTASFDQPNFSRSTRATSARMSLEMVR